MGSTIISTADFGLTDDYIATIKVVILDNVR